MRILVMHMSDFKFEQRLATITLSAQLSPTSKITKAEIMLSDIIILENDKRFRIMKCRPFPSDVGKLITMNNKWSWMEKVYPLKKRLEEFYDENIDC